MNAEFLLDALELPADSLVNQRIPKKLLLEHASPTARDKKAISADLEELFWVAALKPEHLGVPSFRDEIREYLEVAVITLRLKAGGGGRRLAELVHRAIPYPVLLLVEDPLGLSLSAASIRWSQAQAGKTVLDPEAPAAYVDVPEGKLEVLAALRLALATSRQPTANLMAFYLGWLDVLIALQASQVTEVFSLAEAPAELGPRREKLAQHAALLRDITALKVQIRREKQMNRRVDLNLRIKNLEAQLAELEEKL